MAGFIKRFWEHRGHPVEVGIITFALSLWPYLTFVRLIAHFIDSNRQSEYYSDVLPFLTMGLFASLVLQLFVRKSSNRIRMILNGAGSAINIFGMFDFSYLEPQNNTIYE